jgi:membrane protein insertase Oxa1/YidC/SpoIIIJ
MLGHLFVVLIYQPFLNLLAGVYWMLEAGFGVADMGVAVIVFTVIFRLILLPLHLTSHRSEKDRRELEKRVANLKNQFGDDPVILREEIKKIFHTNRSVVFFESFDLAIQIMIMLMLWRMFSKGLLGQDLHLLYKFVPESATPGSFNLMFAGSIDLTKPHFGLSILTGLAIFVMEFLSLKFSPYPLRKNDWMLLGFLPIGAITFFAFMPAGKKLFVLVTVLFSIMLNLARQTAYLIHGVESGSREWAESLGKQVEVLIGKR